MLPLIDTEHFNNVAITSHLAPFSSHKLVRLLRVPGHSTHFMVHLDTDSLRARIRDVHEYATTILQVGDLTLVDAVTVWATGPA